MSIYDAKQLECLKTKGVKTPLKQLFNKHTFLTYEHPIGQCMAALKGHLSVNGVVRVQPPPSITANIIIVHCDPWPTPGQGQAQCSKGGQLRSHLDCPAWHRASKARHSMGSRVATPLLRSCKLPHLTTEPALSTVAHSQSEVQVLVPFKPLIKYHCKRLIQGAGCSSLLARHLCRTLLQKKKKSLGRRIRKEKWEHGFKQT